MAKVHILDVPKEFWDEVKLYKKAAKFHNVNEALVRLIGQGLIQNQDLISKYEQEHPQKAKKGQGKQGKKALSVKALKQAKELKEKYDIDIDPARL